MSTTIDKTWSALFTQKQRLDESAFSIASACAESSRFEDYTIEDGGLLLDFSKQYLDDEALSVLLKFAESKGLVEKIQAFLSGAHYNSTEDRAVLHPVLRGTASSTLEIEGEKIQAQVQTVQAQMASFVEACYQGIQKGYTGKRFTDCVCLGIGGSYLGPVLVIEALAPYAPEQAIRMHFITNLDAETLERTLSTLDPATTLCMISSKTFTTQETMTNTLRVKSWFTAHLGSDAWPTHTVAITAATDKALSWGVSQDHIFPFWDWVGGRFSVWSAIGLPIMLNLGTAVFKDFISGAFEMDCAFRDQPLRHNMPVIMALLGIWNINVLGYPTHAILPYSDALARLPAYCQQLEMESNGKQYDCRGERVSYHTAPVIWGDVGCNGQHAYMQLLHQGTQVVPADFIVPVRARAQDQDLQRALVANALGQSKALMEGQQPCKVDWFRHCDGNRPSSTLMFSELTPKMLGKLLSLYEHKVFVQGVIWEINSFDQFGVELGKALTNQLLPQLMASLNTETDVPEQITDASTRGLLRFYQRYQQGSVEDNGTTSGLSDRWNRRDRDSDLS